MKICVFVAFRYFCVRKDEWSADRSGVCAEILLCELGGPMRLQNQFSRVAWLGTVMLAFVLSLGVSQRAEAACCTGTECTDDNLILCTLRGGNWSIAPCIPFVTCALTGEQGACCMLGTIANLCLPSTEGLCLSSNNFFPGSDCGSIDCRTPPPRGACCSIFGSCDVTTEDQCQDFGSSWVEGATCDDGICGLGGAQGACCQSLGENPICLPVPSVLCIGGSFQAGASCNPSPCGPPPPVMGACCTNGTCTTTTETQCTVNSGIWSSQATCDIADLCAIPDPAGVCCLAANGSCVDVNNAGQCVAGNFVEGESCNQYACPPVQLPEGACCLAGQCTTQTQAACNGMGGTYQGDNSTCQQGLCALPPSPGACCLVGGGCQEGLEAACPTGTWHENESCQTLGLCVLPDPELGCCLPSGCRQLTEDACTLAGGTVTGATCDVNACAPQGSCCDNGTCSQGPQSACAGTWVLGGVCGVDTCPQPPAVGGCCAPNGACSDTTHAECDLIGGGWTPDVCGVRAACDVPVVTGACCKADGCSVMEESACALEGGVFSAGQTCAEVNCVVDGQGACCAGATCSELTESGCATQGGVFTLGGDCDDLAAICPSAEQGACCVNGTCSNTSRFTCAAGNGNFELGGDCNVTNICEPELRGNCCTRGSCSYITEAECLATAGTYLGADACDGVSCAALPALGSCCFKGQCSVVEEGLCEGEWSEATSCDVVECEPYEPTYGGGSIFGRCSSASLTWASSMLSALALLGLLALRRRRLV